jgi:hypothetical protein
MKKTNSSHDKMVINACIADRSRDAATSSPEARGHVPLPSSFKARVNQMASRRGKWEADSWRAAAMQALQEMADGGAPIDGISEALSALEADRADTGCACTCRAKLANAAA